MSGRSDLDLSRRSLEAERMDEARLDPDALATALDQVVQANVLLGGLRSLVRHIRPLARGRETLRLLDVGVGSGGLTERVAGSLARSGVVVRWVGIDLHPDVLAIARRRMSGAAGASGELGRRAPLGLVRSDAARLPFADDSFDVSTATLTLHHMPDDLCRTVLAEMARVSREAVLVSDLERSRLHYLGARVLSATIWRANPLTSHDGPLSVRRSFTRAELERLGAESPFQETEVRRYFPFRLLLEGRP